MKKFYVIGDNVSKSLSPTIFNYWFKKHKINAKYGFVELNTNNFDRRIKQILKDKSVYGLNITIPFKQKIMKHIDALDRHSRTINAVNCVSKNSKIKGTNTDWLGYYKTLPKKKEKNKKVIIIGYGGAALAIHYVLKQKGYKKILIFNRTRKRINFEHELKYTKKPSTIERYLKGASIIINTTPKHPLNKNLIGLVNKKTVLSDIVYSPKDTSFLKNFPHNKKIYGISMLLEQAALCFKLWFGFKPPYDLKLISNLEKKI